MTPDPDRLRQAQLILDAAVEAGYRFRATREGLCVDRPPSVVGKRALSFSRAFNEFRIELMALLVAREQAP